MTQQRGFLARYLRMLSLHMMEAGADVCSAVDPDLKPTWLSLIGSLGETGRTTVMDAARQMQVSHVHVQNLLKAMRASGIVSATADPDDARRTFYSLTKKGKLMLPKVERIRNAMSAAVADVERETGTDLFSAVVAFQEALSVRDWKSRVQEKLR